MSLSELTAKANSELVSQELQRKFVFVTIRLRIVLMCEWNMR